MFIRKAGLRMLVIACLPPLFITSAFAGKSSGVRLGVGGGAFNMRAKIQNDPNTYKAWIPGYTARLGYAFSPSWEVGAMLSGGGKRSDTRGGRTVNLKMPVLPQAYLLGRYYSSPTYGVYGLLSLGALKQEILNTAGQVTSSNRSVALGVGAGMFWDVSDHYTLDVGGFMPGIRLANSNGVLKTYTPGLMATLSYAFGSKSTGDAGRAQVSDNVVEESHFPVAEADAKTRPQSQPVPEEKPEPHLDHDIYLKKLIFRPYSAALNEEAKMILDAAIEQLKAYPKAHIEVAAHSDTSGNADENMKLSEMRAKSVANYLLHHGVHESRISAVGYGDTKPLYDNATAEGRAKNRRVELHLTD